MSLSDFVMLTDLPRLHFLKTWPEYYEQILNGTKKFDLRLNDRDFKVGDILVLQHFDPDTKYYSGAEMTFRIDYLLEGDIPGLVPGYCIMSISQILFKISVKKGGSRAKK